MNVLTVILKYKYSLLWCTFAYTLGMLPHIPTPEGMSLGLPFDKIAHAFLFGVLTFIAIIECGGLKKQLSFSSLLLCWVIGSLFAGGLLEIIQGMFFSTRSAEFGDLLADMFGGVLSLFAILLLRKYKRGTTNNAPSNIDIS